MKKITYKDAGVNIDAGNEAVVRIKKLAKTTYSKNIISDIGSFAALIDLQEIIRQYQHPVLVQSIDGVGTKTIIAKLMKKYTTLGADLLSASCNDILVVGAKPLTMLDYIASDRLEPDIIEQLITGMVNACCENDVSLVGGETAEMPKVYFAHEHDLVGIVTGIVEKDQIINGNAIEIGDKVLGLSSSGLHTNGYSLARKLFLEVAAFSVDKIIPEISQEHTLGEILLMPHINYTKPILDLLGIIKVKGMAHITGGGLLENIPRILPANCTAQINTKAWTVPAVFKTLQKIGNLSLEEMCRTFNMGIGYVLIVRAEDAAMVLKFMQKYQHIFKAVIIGEIISGVRKVNLI